MNRWAADYAMAPNGDVYIPLFRDPGDKETYLAILERKTGALKKIASPISTMSNLIITSDRTAFITTGAMPTGTDGQYILLLDTETDKFLERLALPGTVGRGMAYSGDSVLIPVNGPNNIGGNLYLLKRGQAPVPFLATELEPRAPDHVVRKPGTSLAYFLFQGEPDEASKERFEGRLSDPRLLDPHLEVWDLDARQMVRRIYLQPPATPVMVRTPDGRLVVAHFAVGSQLPVSHVSVVDPETGGVETLKTVLDPSSLQVHGQNLYVASGREPVLEIFHLPDLQSLGLVSFETRPVLSPVTLP